MEKNIFDIISRLREYSHAFTPNWCSSRRAKKALIAVLATVLVLVVWALFSSSSPAPLREELGLSPLSATDENGDKWVLDLVRGQPLSRFKDNSIKFGQPLLVKTDTQIKGSSVSINLVVEGQAGELYVGGVKKNGQWQPSPIFKILDASGKILAVGKFEYG
ncbi:MAG: hypothetical protein ACYS9Y_14935 [Planctomycetota bacterium]|jgi:hypothetical protein